MNNPKLLSARTCVRAILFSLISLSVTACGNDDVALDQIVRPIESPLGMECREVCDSVTTCVDIETNCRNESYNCGWVWHGWWNFSWECDTRRVCDTRQECTSSPTNCREECDKLAFPHDSETALLNALNYWSTSEIETRLNIAASVAQSITQKRIDNGGVFFEAKEAKVTGFDPYAYKTHSAVTGSIVDLAIVAPAVAYNNQVDLYIDGPDQLEMILGLINNAEKYIHLNMMLFFDDTAGQVIGEALANAAKRGVILRVMFDTFMTNVASYTRDSGAAVAGTPINPGLGVIDIIEAGCQPNVLCEVRSTSQETIFLDYDWYNTYRPRLEAQGVPEYMLEMQDNIQDSVESAINVINHQKYMIVDGTQMMFGSSNFGANYQNEEVFPNDAKWLWHDGMAKVVGPLVKHAQKVFVQQWITSAGGDFFADFEGDFYFPSDDVLANLGGTTPMALLLSYPGDPKHINLRHVIEIAQNAKGDVLIENPYTTDLGLLSAFNDLPASQAEKIHMVASLGLTDSPTIGATLRCRSREAVSKGLHIYDFYYGEKFSHIKLAVDVANNTVHYGSYNLNSRSRLHDLELNFIAKDVDLTRHASEVIRFDASQSELKDDLSTYYTYTQSWFTPECWVEDITNWGT